MPQASQGPLHHLHPASLHPPHAQGASRGHAKSWVLAPNSISKKNFIYDCHLRCQRRVSGQLLPLRFGLVRVWPGLVWSGPEPRSVPIVVFINLISTVAFSMFPAPEAASSRSRSSRDRSSRDSSCGQLWWSIRSFGIEQFPFCGLLRLT